MLDPIVVEYAASMNAKPDEDGVVVVRGKKEGRVVYLAMKDGVSAWASDPKQAKRSLNA